MKVNLKDHTCIVTREEGGPKYNGRMKGESLLWHKIKLELIKQGYDVIKKLMWKDGHLTDDNRYYIRSRNLNKKFQDTHDWFMITQEDHAIRFLYEDFNNGELTLTVYRGDD